MPSTFKKNLFRLLHSHLYRMISISDTPNQAKVYARKAEASNDLDSGTNDRGRVFISTTLAALRATTAFQPKKTVNNLSFVILMTILPDLILCSYFIAEFWIRITKSNLMLPLI